jgi:2,4-dienoyl-CoA reductase-like NADH-dependent reductase (Old Yellow Enzyme family)
MTDALELDTPLRLRCGVTLPNRILKSAMTEGLADSEDRPTAFHVTLYRRWSEGGVGTAITGNVMVDRRYLERPGNVVVEDESALDELTGWASAGTSAGNQFWMQISHPGRQCTRMSSNNPVAPSDVQLRLGGLFGRPRALKDDEIVDIIGRYARAAAIAKKAGFTGVQVHGAHGYLANQFLSPRTNVRTDRWGGSLENRARFLREAVRAVRRVVGADYPVSVKLNSSDFQKGAFSLEESCQVASWLVEDGIDLLEISGGTYENARLLGAGSDGEEPERAASTKAREAYFLDYAVAIRRAAAVPLALTGGFRTRTAMLAALRSGEIDVVGLARPLCTEPDVPRRLITGAADEAKDESARAWLGSGMFGPASRFALIRGLNSQAQTAWFYKQIILLSRGGEPELTLTARSALAQHFLGEYGRARARRARRELPAAEPDRAQSS